MALAGETNKRPELSHAAGYANPLARGMLTRQPSSFSKRFILMRHTAFWAALSFRLPSGIIMSAGSARPPINGLIDVIWDVAVAVIVAVT